MRPRAQKTITTAAILAVTLTSVLKKDVLGSFRVENLLAHFLKPIIENNIKDISTGYMISTTYCESCQESVVNKYNEKPISILFDAFQFPQYLAESKKLWADNKFPRT